MAYIDRTFVKKDTGKTLPNNNKKKEVNVVTSETRRIKFRDDNYAVDSGSRFADIVDEIPMDVDEFIKALTDAIENYKQFEIVFSRGGNGYHTNRFTTDYLTNMTLITSFFSSDILRVYVANISIAGRTLTRNYTKALNFTGTNQLNFGDENNVLIYKVIGYK